jgi:hypothetical protein
MESDLPAWGTHNLLSRTQIPELTHSGALGYQRCSTGRCLKHLPARFVAVLTTLHVL